MNITKKEIDINNAVLTVKVTKEDYAEKVDKTLREYRKKMDMPGFRKGNVPMGMVKKMYAKSVTAEEINNIVAEGVSNYIEENDVKLLGQPLPSEGEDQKVFDFDKDEEFEMSFDLGIAPDINFDLDESIVIPFYEIKVDEEMINNQIQSYTSQFGKYEQFDTVEEKDMVRGNVTELDGEGALKSADEGIYAENAVLTPAYMKDDEQKALFVGKKVGDKVVFNPKQAYENDTEVSSFLKIDKADATDLTANFEIEITEITRYLPGDVNQDLFDKVFGEGVVKSEEEFNKKIEESIQKNLEADSNYRFMLDTKQYFVDKFKDLTFPEAFLKRWLLETQEGLTPEKIEEDYPKMIEDLIWQLSSDKVAKENDIKVEYEDVTVYAKKVAAAQFAQYGMIGLDDSMLDGYVQDMLKEESTARNFVDRAAEEKIIATIREKVKLDKKAIAMADFNKLFEEEVMAQDVENSDTKEEESKTEA